MDAPGSDPGGNRGAFTLYGGAGWLRSGDWQAIRPGREPRLETVVRVESLSLPPFIHSSCLEFNLTPLSSVPLFSLTSWLRGSSPRGFILWL